MSYFDLHGVIDLMTSLAWILVDLILAGLVLFRLRATPAGLLMGGAFALMSLKNLLSALFWHLYLNRAYDWGLGGAWAGPGRPSSCSGTCTSSPGPGCPGCCC